MGLGCPKFILLRDYSIKYRDSQSQRQCLGRQWTVLLNRFLWELIKRVFSEWFNFTQMSLQRYWLITRIDCKTRDLANAKSPSSENNHHSIFFSKFSKTIRITGSQTGPQFIPKKQLLLIFLRHCSKWYSMVGRWIEKHQEVHFRPKVTIACCPHIFLCWELHQIPKIWEILWGPRMVPGPDWGDLYHLWDDWRAVLSRSWKSHLAGLMNSGLQTTTEQNGPFLPLLCSSRSRNNSVPWNWAVFIEESTKRPCGLIHGIRDSSL